MTIKELEALIARIDIARGVLDVSFLRPTRRATQRAEESRCHLLAVRNALTAELNSKWQDRLDRAAGRS